MLVLNGTLPAKHLPMLFLSQPPAAIDPLSHLQLTSLTGDGLLKTLLKNWNPLSNHSCPRRGGAPAS